MTHTDARVFRTPSTRLTLGLSPDGQTLRFGGLVSTSRIDCADGSGFFFDTSAGTIKFYCVDGAIYTDGRVTWGDYSMEEVLSEQ